MQKFESIQLDNLVVYDQAKFDFTEGIHVIRGENGSGKSLMFSPIGTLFYHTPPTVARANQAKAFLSKGSRVTLKWENEHKWEFVQRQKGSSVGYQVKKDGEDLDPSRIAAAKDLLQEAFPLSAEQFYTFVYLNSARPNVLLQGTEAQRRQFFEDLFVLDLYESIQGELSKLSAKTKASYETFTYLDKELTHLRAKQWPTDLDKRVHRYTSAVRKITKNLQTLQQKLQAASYVRGLKSQLTFNLGAKTTQQRIEQLESNIGELTQQSKLWQKQQQQLEINSEVKEKRAKIKRRLNELGDADVDLSELTELIEKNREKLQTLKQQHLHWKELQPVQKKFQKLGQPKYSKKKLNKLQAHLESEISRADALIVKFARLTGRKECPTCGHSLGEKHVRHVLHEAKGTRNIARKKLDGLNRDFERYDLLEQLRDFPTDYVFSTHRRIIEKQKKLVAQFNQAQARNQLQKVLASMPKPKKVGKRIADPTDTLRSSQKALLALQKELDVYAELAKQPESVGSFKALNSRANKLQVRLERVNKKLFEAQAAVADRNAVQKQLRKLEKDHSKYRKQAKLKPVYEALSAAYGPKGIKMEHLQHLLQGYQDNLNKFSPLAYRKPTTFRIEAAATGFRILAKRNKIESDVNLLSGAESRFFTLISWLSLIDFLPAAYRTNILLLDEIENGMFPRSKAIMTGVLLPEIAKQVPCLVLVTPQIQSEFYISGAQEYSVVEKNGRSKLVKL